MAKEIVISPHPDDVEIGMGGFIRRLTTAGQQIDLAVVTGDGDLTMAHSGETVAFEQRKKEQRRAADMLGIRDIHWLNFAPASRFDFPQLSGLVSKFDALLPQYSRVYIPLPSYNQDHKIVWDACLAATRPGRVDKLTIWAYEQPMQGHGEPLPVGMAGKVYAKMSQVELDLKIGSVLCHHSQMGGREYSLTGPRGIRALASFRGAEVGSEYAELFYLIRTVI